MSASNKCPVCRQPMEVLPSKNVKSGKLFIQLKCLVDARHFRGFIHDREFIAENFSHHAAIHDSHDDQAN